MCFWKNRIIAIANQTNSKPTPNQSNPLPVFQTQSIPHVLDQMLKKQDRFCFADLYTHAFRLHLSSESSHSSSLTPTHHPLHVIFVRRECERGYAPGSDRALLQRQALVVLLYRFGTRTSGIVYDIASAILKRHDADRTPFSKLQILLQPTAIVKYGRSRTSVVHCWYRC